MKRILFAIMTSVLLIGLISSCAETPITYQFVSDDGVIIATVHGVVQDANTNTRLENITVTFVKNGVVSSVTTDSSGYFLVDGLSTGEYLFTFSGSTEYTVTEEYVYIPSVDDVREYPSDQDYELTITENANLYKKNAGLTGKIYAEDLSGNLTLASGVTVIADFNHNNNYTTVQPTVYSTTTNSEGVFLFDKNLPAMWTNIYTLPFEQSDANFVLTSVPGGIQLIPNVNVKVNDLEASIFSESVKILNSPNDEERFPVNDNINIVLSKEINTDYVDIILRENSSGDELYCTHTWSNNNMSLSIDPYDSLKNNTTYSVFVEGKAEDNVSFNVGLFFTTEGSSDCVIYVAPFGEIDWPINGDIVLKFSKEMVPDECTVELRRNGSWGDKLYPRLTWSDGNTTLTLQPRVPYLYGTIYYLSFGGYDIDELHIYVNGDFTTIDNDISDPIELSYTNLEIQDSIYDQEFPINDSIILEFIGSPIDTSNVNYNITLTNLTYSLSVDTDLLYPSGTFFEVVVNPTAALVYNSNYQITFTIYDSNNNSENESIYFKTVEE